MSLSAQKQQYLLAAGTALIGSYSIGTSIGYSSPSHEELKLEFEDLDDSLFGSILTIGALIGGLLSGGLIDSVGRRGTMLGTALAYTVGWLMIIFRTSSFMLYSARVVLGVAMGVNCMAVPVYIGEVSLAEKRGILGACHQLSSVIAILVTYVLGADGVLKATPLAVVSFVPVVIGTILMFFMPESPAYLVKKNKSRATVMQSLNFLYGQSRYADAQYDLLTDKKHDDLSDFKIGDIMDGPIRKPLLIALGLMMLQQGSGINAVIFYTAKIFESAHTNMSSSVEAIIVSAVQVVFTAIAAIIMDRAGRRLLLLISCAVSILGLGLLCVFYGMQEANPNSVASIEWIPTTALSLYIAGFAFGLGPVPWLMMGELLPTHARGMGTAFCTGSNWLFAFLVTKFFPGMLTSMGNAESYAVFLVLTILGMIFVYLMVPETKGKSFEEIELMFKTFEVSVATIESGGLSINY